MNNSLTQKHENTKPNRSRGQVILLGAAAIAMMLLTLSLTLNSALYAQNIETRPITDTADEVGETIESFKAESASLLYISNQNDEKASTVVTRFERASTLLTNQYGDTKARYVSVTQISTTSGYAVKQDSNRAFTSSGGTSDWTLVSDASDARRFRMKVTESSLAPASTSASASSLQKNVFHVVVNGDYGDTWRMYVFRNGGDIVVATQKPGSNDVVIQSRVSSSTAIIGVTSGTVNGNHEFNGPQYAPPGPETNSELTYAPYEIKYQNGKQASGRYTLLVPSSTFLHTSNLNNGPKKNPYYEGTIYSVTGTASFSGPNMKASVPFAVEPCSFDTSHCTVPEGVLTDATPAV